MPAPYRFRVFLGFPDIAGWTWTVTKGDAPVVPGLLDDSRLRGERDAEAPQPKPMLPWGMSFGLVFDTAGDAERLVVGERVWAVVQALDDADAISVLGVFVGSIAGVEAAPHPSGRMLYRCEALDELAELDQYPVSDNREPDATLVAAYDYVLELLGNAGILGVFEYEAGDWGFFDVHGVGARTVPIREALDQLAESAPRAGELLAEDEHARPDVRPLGHRRFVELGIQTEYTDTPTFSDAQLDGPWKWGAVEMWRRWDVGWIPPAVFDVTAPGPLYGPVIDPDTATAGRLPNVISADVVPLDAVRWRQDGAEAPNYVGIEWKDLVGGERNSQLGQHVAIQQGRRPVPVRLRYASHLAQAGDVTNVLRFYYPDPDQLPGRYIADAFTVAADLVPPAHIASLLHPADGFGSQEASKELAVITDVPAEWNPNFRGGDWVAGVMQSVELRIAKGRYSLGLTIDPYVARAADPGNGEAMNYFDIKASHPAVTFDQLDPAYSIFDYRLIRKDGV